VIAHRLSTTREADKVVVMSLGRIVEIGTHDELIAKRGMYYNPYTMQWRDAGIAADRAGDCHPHQGETMSFGTLMIVFGIFLAACGVIVLLAGNLMWWIQKTDNSFEGPESERSELWEFGRVVRAVILIVGGPVFIFASAEFR
jgi:hypothetical protein